MSDHESLPRYLHVKIIAGPPGSSIRMVPSSDANVETRPDPMTMLEIARQAGPSDAALLEALAARNPILEDVPWGVRAAVERPARPWRRRLEWALRGVARWFDSLADRVDP